MPYSIEEMYAESWLQNGFGSRDGGRKVFWTGLKTTDKSAAYSIYTFFWEVQQYGGFGSFLE